MDPWPLVKKNRSPSLFHVSSFTYIKQNFFHRYHHRRHRRLQRHCHLCRHHLRHYHRYLHQHHYVHRHHHHLNRHYHRRCCFRRRRHHHPHSNQNSRKQLHQRICYHRPYLEFELFIVEGFPRSGVDECHQIVFVADGDVMPVW